jgi:hypothetical protein
MRRPLALVALAWFATACATQPIELKPVYTAGAERIYALRAETTITLDVPGNRRVEHTILEATSTVQVLALDGTDARVRLTLTPIRFERDGVTAEREEQQVELVVAPDGSVRQIASVGGLPADLSPNVEDLAPLLGLPLPSGRLRLGDTWSKTSAGLTGSRPAVQTGVVSALRVEHDYDTVVLRVGTERPLTRTRTVEGTMISLSGTEFSSSEIAYAFRDGFPVRITTSAEGRFSISEGGPSGGTVTIETGSVLELAD